MKYIMYRIKFYLAQFIKFKSPVHLDLELTNICNQKCLSCWHSQKKLPFETNIIDLDYAKNVIDQAYEIGIKSIKLNLRGEPTIYHHIIEVLEYCNNKFVDIMINTNLIVHPQRLIQILNSGLTTIIVSVDSWHKETYCKLHGCPESHFELLMKNLLTLKKLKQKGKLNCRVILNFHRNEINKKELFKIQSFNCFKYNVKDTMKREGKDISIEQKEKKRKRICPHLMRRLTVTVNHKVYPCCVCYTEPEDIKLNSNLTEIYKLDAFWNSFKRQYLISNYKKGKYNKSCQDCTSAEIYK